MNNNIWNSFHKHTSISESYTDYDTSTNYEKQIKENYYNSKEIIHLNQDINQDIIKEVFLKRKSTRNFDKKSKVCLNELTDLLTWSYAISDKYDALKNLAPSAGARYPVEIHIINKNIEGLKRGIYHYNHKTRIIELTNDIEMSDDDLASCCLNQSFIYNSSAVICLCADFYRTISKYGDRGYRYVFIDAGHIGQNLYLMAAKKDIGIVGIGGFEDQKLKNLLSLPMSEYPIYLFAVGKEVSL